MVLLIPQFVLARNLGLLNSLWGLVIVYSVMNLALNTFLLRGFFAAMPQELFDAAAGGRRGRLAQFPVHRPAPGQARSGDGHDLQLPRGLGRVHVGHHHPVRQATCTRCPSGSGCSSARSPPNGASCSRPRSSRSRRCWSCSWPCSATSLPAPSSARRRDSQVERPPGATPDRHCASSLDIIRAGQAPSGAFVAGPRSVSTAMPGSATGRSSPRRWTSSASGDGRPVPRLGRRA